MADETRKITARERRFAELFARNGNATKSAKLAGYNVKGAREQGYRLRQIPEVLAEIERQRAIIRAEDGITAERLERELKKIALADITDFEVDEHGKLTSKKPGMTGAISSLKVKRKTRSDARGNDEHEVETTITLWDKRGAIKDLGISRGLAVKPVAAGPTQTVSVNVKPWVEIVAEAAKTAEADKAEDTSNDDL